MASVPRIRVCAAGLLPAIFILALPLCPLPAAASHPQFPRIVAKDILGGSHAVGLRRFDQGAGAWEVESTGGVVSFVPKGSLALDLGPPLARAPLQPGAAEAYRVGKSSMLNASGHEANTIMGMFATRRIEPG